MRISDWSSDVCSSDLFVEHLFGATIRAVNLVNDYNRLQAQRQRLASYELGLRHCAFRTVDKQDNPVNHGEDALNLTAEIGVAGRINDVYPRAVPFDAGALGKDRDPSFFFEFACVHGALFAALIVANGSDLPKNLVNTPGFPIIAVRV